MIRFYLDEHIPPAVASQGRIRGLDVICAKDAGLLGAPDPVHFERCVSEQRAVVTRDLTDYLPLTAAHALADQPHFGVVFFSHSVAQNNIGTMIRALETLAREFPNGLQPYSVIWLPLVAT